MPSRPHQPFTLRRAASLALGLTTASVVCGQTWTGGAANNNWSVGANWSGGTPPNNGTDIIVFSGTTRPTPNTNTNWSLYSLTFDSAAGAFTLGGNGLTIGAGGVTNNSTSAQTITNQIALSADQTWTAASGAITTTAYFNANSKNITLAGPQAITITGQLASVNTLTMAGAGVRTFNGAVAAGTLSIGGSGSTTFSSGSALNVGGGGIQVNTTGSATFSGAINSGALTLTAGTVTLSGTGNSSLTGATVNGGTLVLDQTGGYAINGNLTVNSGGSVVFEQDNQVRSGGTTLTLAGGAYLNLGDTEQTFQNLNVTGNAVIDFGGGGSSLTITNYGGISIASGATLTILNWNSAVDYFSIGAGYSPSILPQVIFDGLGGATWSGGFVTPVPEPGSYGLLCVGSLIACHLLRRPRRRPASA